MLSTLQRLSHLASEQLYVVGPVLNSHLTDGKTKAQRGKWLARRKILKHWGLPKGVYPGNGRVGSRITPDPGGASLMCGLEEKTLRRKGGELRHCLQASRVVCIELS